jgi:hypothetical protein
MLSETLRSSRDAGGGYIVYAEVHICQLRERLCIAAESVTYRKAIELYLTHAIVVLECNDNVFRT